MTLWTEQQEQREETPSVRREVEIAAPAEEVWDALVTEEGRERWLEADPEREIVVERSSDPGRIVWWWWRDDQPARRVELCVVAIPTGTRVIVTESAPAFPLARLAASLSLVLA